MLDPKLEATVRHWILRILATPKGERAFLKESSCADDDVADYLGLSALVGFAPYNEDSARTALRALIADAGDLQEDRLPDPVAENLRSLAKTFQLDALDARILFSVALVEAAPPFLDTLSVLKSQSGSDYVRNLALALGEPFGKIYRAIRPGESALLRSGLVKWGNGGLRSRNTSSLEIAREGLVDVILHGRFSINAVLKGIAREGDPPTLGLRDFRHLGPLVGDLRAHMARLLRDRSSGGNCFFHGPPGTGKTELARALARSLRCPLIEILGADTEGDPIAAAKRLENLRATQQLLRDRRVVLLFDECEDVFRGESLFRSGLANQRKAWMNRLLENNPMPVIWISNSKGCLDRAFTRRFDIIAEVRSPPEHQRRRLYRRMCAGTVGEPVLHRLAAHDQVTPAVVARAQSVAAGLHTCAEARDATFSRLIEATLHAQGHSAPRLRPSAQPQLLRFDHTYLNPDPPLAQLIARLDKAASCRCLLHGPPGTGKTAFGRWLAQERGSPLHIKRASDLLSPFLGMSEQLLAEAFREAEEERALLMIDEVDTFLRDRRDARHGWEVSQVNEFLTCLENFEGIFLCSTNLAATLDPACLRRFDLKVHLGPLEPPQSRRLLAAHCRHLSLGRPSPAELESVGTLANATPGDFANAARQHTFQPFPSPAAFLTAVERECVAKNASGTRKAGFS